MLAGVVDGRRRFGRCLGIGLLVGWASLGIIIVVEVVLHMLPICWGLTISSGGPWCSGIILYRGNVGFWYWAEVVNSAETAAKVVGNGERRELNSVR